MAIDAINAGSFIPNAAGLPLNLTDTPTEASAKSAKVVTPVADTDEAQTGGSSDGGGAGVDVEA